MDTYSLIQQNFAPMIGLLFTLLFLIHNTSLNASQRRQFIMAALLCVLELLAANQEAYYSQLPYHTQWRVLWSAVGYTVRPVILYMLLGLHTGSNLSVRWFRLAGGLLIFNAVLAFSGFFSDIAYSFNAENQWGRGPLGYTFFFILLFYAILFMTWVVLPGTGDFGFLKVIGIITVILLCLGVYFEYMNYGIGLSRTATVYSLLAYLMYFQSVEYQKERAATTFAAQHDELTGLENRYMFEKMKQEYSKLGRRLGFLIMDIDRFKEVNDQYGHMAGDEVLKKVAELMRDQFRSCDTMIRAGGDEFIILMPGLREEQAHLIERRITRINEALQNPKPANVPATSVSAGLAFSEKGYSEDLYQRADRALYETKNTTRCGITIAK